MANGFHCVIIGQTISASDSFISAPKENTEEFGSSNCGTVAEKLSAVNGDTNSYSQDTSRSAI
jgi:hypothetical protein